MDVNITALFTLFAILQCTREVFSFYGMLDIDEINNVNYGIDILKEPVLFKPQDDSTLNQIHLTSKYGQRYRCYFPDQIETERKTEEKEKEALETGIHDLLKPFESGPCLLKAKDWWSYEFCYGKYIRQFHVEDRKISGDIIYLGYFESEKDWSEKEESDNRLNRYHSQTYVNGTKCDLTGQQRKTEVRFICDEGQGDHIGRIDEPETCSYIMTIHTNTICHHPYLKPIKQSHAVPITCNPVLTENQYLEYQQRVEEEKEKKVREEEEKKRKAEEMKLKFPDSKTDENEEGFTVIDDKEFEENSDEKSGTTTFSNLKDAELKVKVQVINNMEDLEKVFRDLKKIENSGGQLPLESFLGEKEKKKETPEEETKEEEQNKDSQEKTTYNFEKVKPKDKLKSMLTEVVEEMDRTDHTLTQMEKSLSKTDSTKDDPIPNDADDDGLLEEFDKGLDEPKFSDLKSKLKKNKDTLSNLQHQVRDAMQQELDNIIDEAEEELGVDVEDRKKSYKHLTDSLEQLIKRLDNTQEDIEKVDKQIQETTEGLSTEKDETDIKVEGPDKVTDDRVKVRVTRVNRKDLHRSEENKQHSELENVEMQLKDELEKAGLDLAGGQVQVKIITAGYYDKKGEPIKTLSADDSDAFKNMIVSILGGDHEAAKEANKFEEQEENYSFVWENKEKKET